MKNYFIFTIILLIVGSTIHCGNPLEPIAPSWVLVDIPDRIKESNYCSIVAGEDDVIYLCANTSSTNTSVQKRRTTLYALSNTIYTVLFDINGSASIDDYSEEILWGYYKSSNGTRSVFYYDEVLQIINIPGNIGCWDIASYENGDDSGCIFCTDDGIYKYSLNRDEFNNIGYSNFKQITRTDNGKYFFLERGDSYTVGVMDSIESNIVVETVPIPFKGWNFREGPDIYEVYSLGNFSECAIGSYFTFIAEIGINDAWYQCVLMRNDSPAGEGEYEVLLLNPLYGPFTYALTDISGLNKSNMRVVGINGASFVCRNGIWEKEHDPVGNLTNFHGIISTNDGYFVMNGGYYMGELSWLYAPH